MFNFSFFESQNNDYERSAWLLKMTFGGRDASAQRVMIMITISIHIQVSSYDHMVSDKRLNRFCICLIYLDDDESFNQVTCDHWSDTVHSLIRPIHWPDALWSKRRIRKAAMWCGNTWDNSCRCWAVYSLMSKETWLPALSRLFKSIRWGLSIKHERKSANGSFCMKKCAWSQLTFI